MNEPPNKKQFVVIKPYQTDDDLAFGVWNELLNAYELGDGDVYATDQLCRVWGCAVTFLTWTDVENKFKP